MFHHTKPLNPAIASAKNSELLVKILLFTLRVILLISQNTQNIGDRMFWKDEVSTYLTSILPLWEIPLDAAVTSGQMQPPIFYWIGHLVSYVGTDPITLRSISVICYIFLLGFIIFNLRELHIASRFLLGFTLIIVPFAAYAAREFRPYALAVVAILVSSVFLYRLLKHPSDRILAFKYGLSALLLQYSLTLNSYVFGVQMLFVSGYLLVSIKKEGMQEGIKNNRTIIFISALLCAQYIIFLYIISSNSPYYSSGSHIGFVEQLKGNSDTLFNALRIRSWVQVVILSLFAAGLVLGVFLYSWPVLYLVLIFVGQFMFSTYLTYASIDWFSQRYLVASYVAFALICALGAEIVFRRMGRRSPVVFSILLVLGPLYSGVVAYVSALDKQTFNPIIAVVEKLRCTNKMTIVLSVPRWISKVPWYAYRDDPSIKVPYDKNVDKVIADGVKQRHCFILQELKGHESSSVFDKLSELPDYSKRKYSTKPGVHVPDSAWLFIPVNTHLKQE